MVETMFGLNSFFLIIIIINENLITKNDDEWELEAI